MTGPEHYRKAEDLVAAAIQRHDEEDIEGARSLFAAAQIHATLALAAATAQGTPIEQCELSGMPRVDAEAWHDVCGVQLGGEPE